MNNSTLVPGIIAIAAKPTQRDSGNRVWAMVAATLMRTSLQSGHGDTCAYPDCGHRGEWVGDVVVSGAGGSARHRAMTQTYDLPCVCSEHALAVSYGHSLPPAVLAKIREDFAAAGFGPSQMHAATELRAA